MAIWQYRFRIIPDDINLKIEVDEMGLLDDEKMWVNAAIDRDYFYEIGNILIRNKSWADWIDLYGDQDSNCFEVSHEDGKVFGASFRIDFTDDYDDLIRDIVGFCKEKKLKILDSDLTPVTLSFMGLKTKIVNSRNKDNLDRLNSGKAPDLDFLKDKNKKGFNS